MSQSLHGLKSTRQREAILGVFRPGLAPMSAEEVAAQVADQYPQLALSTVYRNLERFVEVGLLERSQLGDGVTRYALHQEKHGHYLVCTCCDAKIRIEGCPLRTVEEKLEQDTGYAISGHNLTLYGICPHCRAQQNKNSKGQ